VGQKLSSDQENLKAKPRLLNTGYPVVATSAPQRELKPWIFAAWFLSLFFHGLLVFLWVPKLEVLADIFPKKSQKVEIQFKPVIKIAPTQSPPPKKADFLAEIDQSTLLEKKARQRPLKIQKIQKTQKTRSANDFLAKPKTPDPLGLMAHAPNSDALAEHLPNIVEEQETKLNTWSWRHAPFFNRIKTQVGHAWAPARQIERFDPQGTLLGQKDRVTILSVTIDPKGKLKALHIALSSGVAYLDEEAERAFKKAAPFPFPPRDLFNTQEGFSFQFAFYLQQNKGMKFDFDWHKSD
jgi:TonB family protein